MADALARVTATLYRPDGSGVPTALLPLVGARVVATPVLLDETAAIIGSRARVVGVTDAAGVLWQTDPPPAEGALPGLSLAPGSWSWALPDRETTSTHPPHCTAAPLSYGRAGPFRTSWADRYSCARCV